MAVEYCSAEPTLEHPVSQLCTQAQVDSRAYRRWCALMREEPRYHRKQWEFCYILEALAEAGFMEPGFRGIGFGVGREPMSAILAHYGCQILATDLSPDAAQARPWVESNQTARSYEQLNDRGLCDPAAFAERVRFEHVDMNVIPEALSRGEFDFTWSSCALEHLGSLDLGRRFIENSLRCLRPGGIAVHTTEFNVSSDDGTLESGGTVLYRRRDIRSLAEGLAAEGHAMVLNFHEGSGEVDRHVDEPPYSGPHLKLRTDGYVATTLGLIIRKRS